MAKHECFTVASTAYLRNLDNEDRRATTFAVHYQKPPEKTERGTSIGLIFPTLLVTQYLQEPWAIAEKVARILNAHWDDDDSQAQAEADAGQSPERGIDA